jgi:hypothetical protein
MDANKNKAALTCLIKRLRASYYQAILDKAHYQYR